MITRATPSSSSTRTSCGIGSAPTASCPPVIADGAVVEQRNVMCAPAATAARIARLPEWWKVPSPMFWTQCEALAGSANGCVPSQCAPSPPICVSPVTSPTCPSGISMTMRVAADARADQRALGRGGRRGVVRAARAVERRAVAPGDRQVDPGAPAAAALVPRDHARELGPRCASSRRARPVATASGSRSPWTANSGAPSGPVLPCDGGRPGPAVEPLLDLGLEERALLLDDDDLVEAVGEVVDDAGLERPGHPDAQQPDAAGGELRVVEAEGGRAPAGGRASSSRRRRSRPGAGPRPRIVFSPLAAA